MHDRREHEEFGTLLDVSALVVVESAARPEGPVAIIAELDTLFSEGRVEDSTLRDVLRAFDRYPTRF